MNFKTKIRLCTAIALLMTVVGCSGGSYAPVSGVVKINGKPYDKAVVTFQPIGTPSSPNPGRGSSAYTDANGRFELICDDRKGAIIGKHLVRIMTRGNEVVGASPEGGSSDETPTNRTVDPIPAEWNSMSKVEFEVPASGTDKANFDIETKRPVK